MPLVCCKFTDSFSKREFSPFSQPYMHPALKIKEPPLLSVQEFMAEFIQPLLTVEDNGGVSSTLVLNILLTAMSSSQASRTQQHWILDEKPFEILFTMLEMYQDCKRFWKDWVSEARFVS